LFGDELENQTLILKAQQEIRRIELEYANELLDLERRRAEIGEERYQNELTYINAIRDASIKASNERVAAEQRVVAATRKTERTDINRAIKKRMEELERSIDPAVLAVQRLDSVFDNMGRAIDTFVDTGKFKFGEFARSIIADIAKIALKQATTKIFTTILGGLFGKAAGGPVKGNTPYLVGENGPELFVPNSMGSVMPNHALNKNAGTGESMAPVINNTYITNNINALDSRSVAQVFVENRKALLGAASMASKEMPYGG
jgi:phage-related minor tail protein